MYMTLEEFLNETAAQYLTVVPKHWLEQSTPLATVQIVTSIVFLIICIPGNITQILLFIAYFR